MKDMQYYDGLPWDVRIERDLQRDGTVYYIARHPEFGDVAGPLGTGSSPEEAIADLHEARRSPAHLAPPLSFRDAGNLLLIRQELPGQATLHHRLRGTSRAIYLACETMVEFAELARLFPKLGTAQLATFLEELTAKRLLFAQGTRYLALAVHTAKGL